MNDIEQENINSYFGGNSKGKTMEDYFTQLEILVIGSLNKNELKAEFKKYYPDISDWSF